MRARLTDKLGMSVSFTPMSLKPRRGCGGAVHDPRGYELRGHAYCRSHHGGRRDQHVRQGPRELDAAASGQGRVRRCAARAGAADRASCMPRVPTSRRRTSRSSARGTMASASVSTTYRGERLLSHGGGWIGWGTLLSIVPDLGIGVAVFTNRSPQRRDGYPDPVRRRPVTRPRAGRLARALSANSAARRWRKCRPTRTRTRPRATPARSRRTSLPTMPASYEHPAYGVMSIAQEGGALTWSWRGMSAALAHRHYETFELPRDARSPVAGPACHHIPDRS